MMKIILNDNFNFEAKEVNEFLQKIYKSLPVYTETRVDINIFFGSKQSAKIKTNIFYLSLNILSNLNIIELDAEARGSMRLGVKVMRDNLDLRLSQNYGEEDYINVQEFCSIKKYELEKIAYYIHSYSQNYANLTELDKIFFLNNLKSFLCSDQIGNCIGGLNTLIESTLFGFSSKNNFKSDLTLFVKSTINKHILDFMRKYELMSAAGTEVHVYNYLSNELIKWLAIDWIEQIRDGYINEHNFHRNIIFNDKVEDINLLWENHVIFDLSNLYENINLIYDYIYKCVNDICELDISNYSFQSYDALSKKLDIFGPGEVFELYYCINDDFELKANHKEIIFCNIFKRMMDSGKISFSKEDIFNIERDVFVHAVGAKLCQINLNNQNSNIIDMSYDMVKNILLNKHSGFMIFLFSNKLFEYLKNIYNELSIQDLSVFTDNLLDFLVDMNCDAEIVFLYDNFFNEKKSNSIDYKLKNKFIVKLVIDDNIYVFNKIFIDDFNIKNEYVSSKSFGDTILMIASSVKDGKIFSKLLPKANVSVKNENNKNLLHCIQDSAVATLNSYCDGEYRMQEMQNLLHDLYECKIPLLKAMEDNSETVIDYILELGKGVKYSSESVENIILNALIHDDMYIFKKFTDLYTDLEEDVLFKIVIANKFTLQNSSIDDIYKVIKKDQIPVLMYFLMNSNQLCVEVQEYIWSIRKKTNIYLLDAKSDSALSYAVKYCNVDWYMYLLIEYIRNDKLIPKFDEKDFIEFVNHILNTEQIKIKKNILNKAVDLDISYNEIMHFIFANKKNNDLRDTILQCLHGANKLNKAFTDLVRNDLLCVCEILAYCLQMQDKDFCLQFLDIVMKYTLFSACENNFKVSVLNIFIIYGNKFFDVKYKEIFNLNLDYDDSLSSLMLRIIRFNLESGYDRLIYFMNQHGKNFSEVDELEFLTLSINHNFVPYLKYILESKKDYIFKLDEMLKNKLDYICRVNKLNFTHDNDNMMCNVRNDFLCHIIKNDHADAFNDYINKIDNWSNDSLEYLSSILKKGFPISLLNSIYDNKLWTVMEKYFSISDYINIFHKAKKRNNFEFAANIYIKYLDSSNVAVEYTSKLHSLNKKLLFDNDMIVLLQNKNAKFYGLSCVNDYDVARLFVHMFYFNSYNYCLHLNILCAIGNQHELPFNELCAQDVIDIAYKAIDNQYYALFKKLIMVHYVNICPMQIQKLRDHAKTHTVVLDIINDCNENMEQVNSIHVTNHAPKWNL